MMTVLRAAAAFAAGITVALIVVATVEWFSAIVHPFPEDFGGTRAEVSRHVERYPAWVLALVVPAWGGAALAGTWTTGRLGNRGYALVLGLLLLSAVILNLSMLPYPLWFKAACLIVIPTAVVFGDRWSGRRPFAARGIATSDGKHE